MEIQDSEYYSFQLMEDLDEESSSENDTVDIDINSGESYGVKETDIESIRQQCAEDDRIEDIRVVSRSLQNVKAHVKKLQQEHDLTISNSISIDERLESVKVDMIDLRQRISSSASIELLEDVKRMVDTKSLRAEQNLEEFKSIFMVQVNGQIDQDMTNLKTWFGDLEVLVKQRQTKLETLVGSCAKEYNVAALEERIDSDVAALGRKATFLHDVVKAQGRAFVAWQKKL